MPKIGRVVTALLTLALAFGARAEAQRPITIVAGPNFTTVSGDDFDNPETRTGFFAGIGTAMPVSPVVSVRPFVAYVQKGWKEGDDFEVKLTYIEVPILFTYTMPMGTGGSALALNAGPQVSFNLGCDQTEGDISGDCEDAGNQIKSLDYGVVLSANLGFPLGSMMAGIGGGYDLGLSEFAEDEDGEAFDLKNRGFYISIGLSFNTGS